MTLVVGLLRHASTAWNALGRIQGRRDIPLDAQGREQANRWRVTERASGAAQWISSPLQRAVETARLMSGREPHCEDALVEMDWGGWEGLTLAEIRARAGAEMARMEARGLDFRPPGGESPRDVQARVLSWLAQRAAAQREPLIVVTHKGVLRAVLAAATGWDMTDKPPLRLRNDALHRFAIDAAGVVSIVACNVALHGEAAPNLRRAEAGS
ncbi:MAG: histidine phosphatase family protein [Betaproteobacteria bacterium]